MQQRPARSSQAAARDLDSVIRITPEARPVKSGKSPHMNSLGQSFHAVNLERIPKAAASLILS